MAEVDRMLHELSFQKQYAQGFMAAVGDLSREIMEMRTPVDEFCKFGHATPGVASLFRLF